MIFLFKLFKNHSNRKELKKSNYGREFGWYIEYQGKILGELIDYNFTDMFWDSYRIVASNRNSKRILFDENSWHNLEFRFRNKKYEKYAKNVFANFSLINLISTKRIEMRGLYLLELQFESLIKPCIIDDYL